MAISGGQTAMSADWCEAVGRPLVGVSGWKTAGWYKRWADRYVVHHGLLIGVSGWKTAGAWLDYVRILYMHASNFF